MNAEQQRAEELLVDWVTEGLSADSNRELDALLSGHPEIDVESYELAAAAIDLAFDSGPKESMPSSLRQRLSTQAADFAASSESRRDDDESGKDPESANVLNFPSTNQPSAEPRSGWVNRLAIAASLLLAVAGWTAFFSASSGPGEPSPSQALQALISSNASDLVQLSWTATEDPAASAATGDVVWSVDRQEGYMTFAGLPANDPSVAQYQLWIFDAEQDERYPIDGGVFDIPASATGEVVVPIDAKLNVTQPTLFAITIEKPGGVVVSSRERLPLLAKVG